MIIPNKEIREKVKKILDVADADMIFKSAEHVRATSLNNYIKRYSPKYSIRISGKNFGFENGIKSVPLYAVFCI